MKFHNLLAFTLIAILTTLSTAHAEEPKPLPNPFFAMDTSYHHKDLTREQELDLVKRLGFAGVSEDVRPADQIKTELAELEGRGQKLYAVYASARATPEGGVVVPQDLPAVMEALKGHGTIIWLHIGGKGPAFDKLTGNEPMIITLRQLAATAKADGLRIAIYPHFGEYIAHFGDALKLANVVNHEALGVTFNLSHCLATGDEDQVATLIGAAGPRLFCVTINGANTGVKGANWGRLIQPLGEGSYKVKIVLDALQSSHYAGPIGFQGYGIKGDARSMLEPTMKAWKAVSTSSR